MSIVSKGVIIFATLYAVIAIFQLLKAPENRDRAAAAAHANTKMRTELYESTNRVLDHGTEDEKAIVATYADVMCNLVGELCERDQAVRYTEGTVAQTFATAMSIPFMNPPASGVHWAKNTLENAGFIPKSYAQGMGFASLSSFQIIWKAMRDITFLLLVLIIMVSGFIVMFNIPLGGKKNVQIEALLPRLVITLLMISFSYAIAGFLIDMMYVMLALVVTVFDPVIQGSQAEYMGAALTSTPTNLFGLIWITPLANGDIWDVSTSLLKLIPGPIRYIIDSVLYYGLGHLLLAIGLSGLTPVNGMKGLSKAKQVTATIGKAVFATQSRPIFDIMGKLGNFSQNAQKMAESAQGSSVGAGISIGASANVNVGITILVFILNMIIIEPLMAVFRSYLTVFFLLILLMLSLLFVFVKIFFKLFSTYVEIILSIMFAPIYIVFNALPESTAFTSWLKQLAINLLTFPTVMAILLVVAYLTQFADTTEMWTPPFITGFATQRAIQVLVAGTIMFNIGKLVDMMKEKLGYKKGFSMSPMSMIAPFIAVGAGMANMAIGTGKLRDSLTKKGGLQGKINEGAAGGSPPTS